MKFIFILFILFQLFFVKSDILEQLNLIKNDELNSSIFYKNLFQNVLNNYLDKNNLNNEDTDFMNKVIEFINTYTNVMQARMFEELYACAMSVVFDRTHNSPNYLTIIGYSGKDLSDLGLQDECLRYNFSYFLFVYEYINGSFVVHAKQRNTSLFFQQNTFFTGVCLPKICNPILKFLFNKTEDPALYPFLEENFYINNLRVYEVGSTNKKNKTNPSNTYDMDGKYDENKTKEEEIKYYFFYGFIGAIIFILSFQFVVSIVFHFCFNPIEKTRELKKEKELDDDKSDDSEDLSPQIFKDINIKQEHKNTCLERPFCEFLFNYLSLFDNIKTLVLKKNKYFDSMNLEIITYLRIIAMILITFINNFEVLIKIPSKNFFYEKYYIDYSTVFLKFASFSIEIWLCLDGFESMYKLISFYKKYIYDNKDNKIFIHLIKFYFCSVYKFISFIIFFFIVNYFNKYFIYFLTEGPLFEYYSNHIYKEKLDQSKLFKFLIPGYSLYFGYFYKSSLFKNLYISKFSLIFINEFYSYTLLLVLFYLSLFFKSEIYDYIVLSINFIFYFLNYWLVQFDPEENIFYSYKIALDNFLTTKYPHLVFNFFFLGAMAALICFYYKDSFLSNSICNESNKYPFKFCYKSIKFFDFLIQKGRKFWILFLLIIQIILSFSFYLLVRINDNSLFIKYDSLQKFISCYESGLFVFLFCIMLILIILIRSENEVKEKNKSTIIYLIERINFSFFQTINLFMYTFYCFFYFQLQFSIQNLFIVTFGLFFVVCFGNIILTLSFVFLFKMANKQLIKKLINVYDNDDRLSRSSITLEKPLIRDTIISTNM